MSRGFRFLSHIEFDLLSAEQKWVYLRDAYSELNREFEALARGTEKIGRLPELPELLSSMHILREPSAD